MASYNASVAFFVCFLIAGRLCHYTHALVEFFYYNFEWCKCQIRGLLNSAFLAKMFLMVVVSFTSVISVIELADNFGSLKLPKLSLDVFVSLTTDNFANQITPHW